MPDCPYCERSFADEIRIRKHLYEDHESDELGRIDTKRVEQYIDDHDLEESDDATRAQQDTEETVGMTPATDRQSDERWELHDVQALSTEEIRDKLAEHGIDTTEASFRDRAAEVDSAMALADQWEDDHDDVARGTIRISSGWRLKCSGAGGHPISPIGNGSTTWYRKAENSVSRATTPSLPAMADCLGDHYRRHAGRHHDKSRRLMITSRMCSHSNHSCGRSTTTLPPWQRTIQPITSDASNSVGGLYPVSGCT